MTKSETMTHHRSHHLAAALCAPLLLFAASCTHTHDPAEKPTSTTPTPTSTATGATPHHATSHTITSSGKKRTYVLSVPANARTNTRIPVIFAFHGHVSSAREMEKYSGLDKLPALVVYPQGEPGDPTSPGASWESAPYATTNHGAQDSQLVKDLVTALDNRYPIDHSRIYASGKSNGGGFAAKLGCTMPTLFAAVAPVSGAYYDDTHNTRPAGCAAVTARTRVSIMEVHGTADTTMRYNGGVAHGAPYISGGRLVAEFARRNHCVTPPATNPPTKDGGQQFAWSSCPSGAEAVHYKVTDAGHNWPGSAAPEVGGKGPYVDSFPTTDLIWQFFSRHHK